MLFSFSFIRLHHTQQHQPRRAVRESKQLLPVALLNCICPLCLREKYQPQHKPLKHTPLITALARPNRIHLDCANVTLHSICLLLSPTASVLIKIYPSAFWVSAQHAWHIAMWFIGGWDLQRLWMNSSFCDYWLRMGSGNLWQSALCSSISSGMRWYCRSRVFECVV